MAATGRKNGRKRLHHELDTPFSAVAWPPVQSEHQDVILELLCSLLSPLGQHRTRHIKPSKGIWARAKCRRDKAHAVSAVSAIAAVAPPPAGPELRKFVHVGLAEITRNLQAACRPSAADKMSGLAPAAPAAPAAGRAETRIRQHYSVIFVARAGQSSAFNCHLPQIVAVAARQCPAGQQTRLVALPAPCAGRLSSVLAIPRVSSVGLLAGAPGADAIVDFVRQNVPLVEIPWLAEAAQAQFRPTSLLAVETTVGTKKAKPGKRAEPAELAESARSISQAGQQQGSEIR